MKKILLAAILVTTIAQSACIPSLCDGAVRGALNDYKSRISSRFTEYAGALDALAVISITLSKANTMKTAQIKRKSLRSRILYLKLREEIKHAKSIELIKNQERKFTNE